MFAIERFQLDEEAPAQLQQQQRQDGRQGEHKAPKEGGASRQQSQLLAEHLARVRARKEARLREQDGGGDDVGKGEKKKRKRVEGAAAELPAHEATAPARGVQDDGGDGEKRKRKKDKKEKQLPDDTSVHSPAPASEEAEAPTEPVVDMEMKRSSGLDAVRRLLSGHLMKGRAAPPAPPQPPQQAHQRAAVAPSAGPPVPSGKNEEENPAKIAERKHKEEQHREEKEQERAVAAEDGALSVGAACAKWGLDARLAPALEAQGIERFFAVQCRVLPYLVSSAEAELVRDAVVCAPTGSGKTLVYVLALLQGLRGRRVVRLRGLVVVPNRDLAIQVLSELQRYAPAVGLKVGLAIGQSDFAQEQRALVGEEEDEESEEEDEKEDGEREASTPAISQPSSLRRLLLRRRRRSPYQGSHEHQGGRSKVDILVATPGRLMDHMERTPGFTLQHLRYLVLDEVDRLVNQSYQNWAPRVQDAAHGQDPGVVAVLTSPSSGSSDNDAAGRDEGVDGAIVGQYVLRPTMVRIRPRMQRETVRLPFLPPAPLRKLLFSATFTADPQKAALLDLRNPRYFSVTGAMSEGGAPAARLAALNTAGGAKDVKNKMKGLTTTAGAGGVDEENEELAAEGGGAVSTPATLREEYVVCESQEKPLVLLALLERELKEDSGIVLVFTSSLDSTHRLCRLLQLCLLAQHPSSSTSSVSSSSQSVREFSSSLSQPQRAELIKQCLESNKGKDKKKTGGESSVRVLVSSDGMARGMDLPNVAAVVNYDVPTQARTYVHRVGRTARAGRAGRALSLVKRGQEAAFSRMRGAVDGRRAVERVSLKRLGDLAPLQPGYHRALRALKEVLSRERQGKLRVAEPMSKESHGQLLASLFASSSPAAVAAADSGVGGVGEREEEEEEEI